MLRFLLRSMATTPLPIGKVSVASSIIKQTNRKGNRVANLALVVANLVGLAKTIKEKTFPIVKLYACKECSSLASVHFDTENNTIKVKKCRCA